MGRNITASHYVDVNLAVRQEPQQRERDRRREGELPGASGSGGRGRQYVEFVQD